jgi:hypothetical protein
MWCKDQEQDQLQGQHVSHEWQPVHSHLPFSFFGEKWIWALTQENLKWRIFNIEITDLESLKLIVKQGKILIEVYTVGYMNENVQLV